jgi:hypothetical protein
MIFKPIGKSIVKHDDFPCTELMDSMIPLEPHHLGRPTHKEMALFSKKNSSYADNRKITIISNSVVIIKL